MERQDGTWERGGTVGESAGTEFAAAVSALKRRSGLSYGTLARQLHFSTSTLHRYCSGAALPAEYAPVERLARACGAEPGELVDLHRLWLLADAERHRKPPRVPPAGARTSAAESAGPDRSVAGDDAVGDADSGVAETGDADTGVAETDTVGKAPDGSSETPPPAPPKSAWRHRVPGRLPLALCLALVLVGTVALVGFRPWQGTGTAAERGGPTESDTTDETVATPDPPPREPPPPAEAPEPSPDGEESEPAAPSPDASEETTPAEAPLDWTVRQHVWAHSCGHPFLVDREPEEVPDPPVRQDTEAWADALDAVHGGSTVVETTLRPSRDEPVVVEALHVRVEGRAEPLPWNLYVTGKACGGALRHAAFRVDLEEDQPQPVPVDGFDPLTEEEIPPPRLPFQVSEEEPLSLRVEAETEHCDCTWRIEIEWSRGRDRGTLVIDDEGRPFRTGAPGDNATYVPDRDGWQEKPE